MSVVGDIVEAMASPDEFESSALPPVGGELLDGLNPSQYDAVLHEEGPLLVVAGAGSGKTKVLTHRIAHLITERGVSPFEILAITFTNKAAEEMKTRIGALIGPVAERMWVSTFHSACVRILRRDADRIGFPSQFSIYDQADSRRLVSYVIRDLGLPEDKTNPNGSGISLGHPISATGCILTVKAMYELERTSGRYALVTMCIGGGLGIAAIFERL